MTTLGYMVALWQRSGDGGRAHTKIIIYIMQFLFDVMTECLWYPTWWVYVVGVRGGCTWWVYVVGVRGGCTAGFAAGCSVIECSPGNSPMPSNKSAYSVTSWLSTASSLLN